jgi:hypothetical protein
MDFSAKVRWRMRCDRNPLFLILQDKYSVREFARAKEVPTAKLLFVTDKPEEIPFDYLPPHYFIKATHGSGWNILCFNKEHYYYGHGDNFLNKNGSLLIFESASNYLISKYRVIDICKKWLKTTYSIKEWAYQFINPKIIVEELLFSPFENILFNYSLFTFNGQVKAIRLDSVPFMKYLDGFLFDTNWNVMAPVKEKGLSRSFLPQKPDRLGELLDMAGRLGENIDFVRVDLYDTSRGIVLGEMTIYPDAGAVDSPVS